MWRKYQIEILTAITIAFFLWLASTLIEVKETQAVIVNSQSISNVTLKDVDRNVEANGNRLTALETTISERDRITVGRFSP